MNKIIISLLISICLTSQVCYTQTKTDSLQTLLKKAKQDTTKLRLLVALSEECDEPDILKYAKPAIELADVILNSNTITSEAKQSVNKQKAQALNNIGYIYNRQGQIKEALNYYHRSLKIQEEINDKIGIAASLINIGFIYNNQGNATQALDYYQKSLKIQEEIKDNYGISYSLNNIGAIYEKQGDEKQALNYNLKALKLAEELGNKQLQANTLGNIGTSYYKQGQLKVSLTYYTRSLKIREEINDKKGVANSLNNIGTIYLKEKNYSLALAYSDSSLTIAKAIGYPAYIGNAEFVLSIIDSARGNGTGAFEHYKQYIIYRDSISNAETRKASIKKQMQYEYEKKEAKFIAEQEKKDAIALEEKQKQQLFLILVSCILLLVAVFSIFIYRALRITRKQKRIIELQKEEVERQKHLVDKAFKELHEKNEEVMASIRYAKRIQDAMLTPLRYINDCLNRLNGGNKPPSK